MTKIEESLTFSFFQNSMNDKNFNFQDYSVTSSEKKDTSMFRETLEFLQFSRVKVFSRCKSTFGKKKF